MNIERILSEMRGVAKPQRKFLVVVLTVMMYLRGKANFRNMSRYSDLSEKTYSRWYRREFDFVDFNQRSLKETVDKAEEMVAVVDCSFCKKSGKKTYAGTKRSLSLYLLFVKFALLISKKSGTFRESGKKSVPNAIKLSYFRSEYKPSKIRF